MDEIDTSGHPLHAAAQADLSRLMLEIVRITGRPTQWTGDVIVRGMDFGPAGQKHGWCGISIREDILAVPEYRWATMIHEALHSVSAAFSPARLDPINQRWEEAIIEQTQRLLRPELLGRLGIDFNQDTLSARDAAHRYNTYIRAIEMQRTAEGRGPRDFYLRLLGLAPPARVRFLIAALRGLAAERERGP